MNSSYTPVYNQLEPEEKSKIDILMNKIILESRSVGFAFHGIDFPALAVQDSLANWVLQSRNWPMDIAAKPSHDLK